jgi:hypothetical protein
VQRAARKEAVRTGRLAAGVPCNGDELGGERDRLDGPDVLGLELTPAPGRRLLGRGTRIREHRRQLARIGVTQVDEQLRLPGDGGRDPGRQNDRPGRRHAGMLGADLLHSQGDLRRREAGVVATIHRRGARV